MKNILKFDDFLSKIQEGLGDKYLKNKYHIPNEFDDFENTYRNIKSKEENENIIGRIKNIVPVIKNPKDFTKLSNGVRGIITNKGDIYLPTTSHNIIHIDILEFLNKKGIITEEATGWEQINKRPPVEFITVQRVWNKNIVAIGESYVIPKRDPEKSESLEIFKPFLDKCKTKNPNIKFVPIQIRSAAREYLNDREKKEFRNF